MKIATSHQPLHYARLQGGSVSEKPNNSTGTDQLDELREDNPTLSRLLDCSHASLDVAEAFGHSKSKPMRVWNGSVSAMAGVWGADRLVHAQNWIERVEGIGHLALAAETGLEAAEIELEAMEARKGLNTGLGLIHAAGELVVGAADAVRGHQEGSQRRLLAGIGQFTVGAAVATATLAPNLGPAAAVAILAATALRQAQLGPLF